jgi:hypothetical protein
MVNGQRSTVVVDSSGQSWIVVSMFGVASSIRGLAFDSHHVLVSFARVASFFACAIHVFATP